jgi:hypothetical protein
LGENDETKKNAYCKNLMNKRQSPELDAVQNFICIRRHDTLQRNRPESRRRADDQHPVSSPRGAQCKLQQLRGFSGTGATLQNKPHANESADSSIYAKPSSNEPQHHNAKRATASQCLWQAAICAANGAAEQEEDFKNFNSDGVMSIFRTETFESNGVLMGPP